MAIKRYPPSYSKDKKYPPQYDLEKIDVYLDASPGEYFNVNGLPTEIGFGKHSFTLYVTEPEGQVPLKNYGNILIEVKDANGTLIYSGITDDCDISGAVICYLWIKQDPLRTTKSIVDGTGTLTIVGQLSNVPNAYKDKYNLRTTFPINIRKSYPNISPIIFQSSSLVQDTLTISEQLEADIDNANYNRSYADITIKNLETYGGQIETIQISYLESGSLSGLTDDDYTLLTQHTIQRTSASFEDEIDFRIGDGLNPISQSFKVLMPPMANQSGSNFGLGDNKFKFKFEFLNKNNDKAKAVSTNDDLIITSSYINFAGPATVITGEDNLLAGQMYIGNSVGQGIEASAENSAFLRSIGYLGFTSASAGSGSGFMLYSGSVLGANTDDYSQGGVGFEFVSSSEAYMRFSTNPSLFDVRAKTFFVGSENTQFISGSGSNVEISSSKFHLKADGSVTMSGQLAVEAGGQIGGFTISDTALSTDAFILSSSQDEADPVSFISSSNFKVGAAGQVTASNIYIEGAVITGSTDIDVDSIKAKGVSIGGADTSQVSASTFIATTIKDFDIASGSQYSTASFGKVIGTSGSLDYLYLDGNMTSSGHISASGLRIENKSYFGDSIEIDGNVTANTFTTNIITQNFSEGSTAFGDSGDDTHIFTGSILATGSLSVRIGGTANNTLTIEDVATGIGHPTINSTGTLFLQNNGGPTQIGGDLLPTTTRDGDDLGSLGREFSNLFVVSSSVSHSIVNENLVVGLTGSFGMIHQDDNEKIILGTGRDLQIYHSGTNSMIHDAGSGDLKILGTNLKLQDKDGGDYIQMIDNSGVTIYHNTNEKLQTQAGGVQVTGHITASGDISASGTIYAQTFQSGDGQGGADIDFNDSIDVTGHITASQNISASGDLYSQNQYLGEYMYRANDTDTWLRFLDNRIVFTAGNNTMIDIDNVTTETLILGHTSKKATLQGTHLTLTGPVTASNDITASGTIYGSGLDIDGTSNLDAVDIDGNVDVAGTLTLNDATTTPSTISSPIYFSDFGGSGWRIESGSTATSFTVDDLTVRGSMNVFELLIHQIRATNGSLFVSNTAKLYSASLVEGGSVMEYKLHFDSGSSYGHSFQPGDLIRAQRWVPDGNGSGSTDYVSDLTIVSVQGVSESIARLTGSMSDNAPQIGYEYVRIGNLTDSNRQGSIYMTADDGHAPFIDISDGVDTHAGFNTAGKIKTRMGKLSGVSSDIFPNVGTGEHLYGFYASGSAFLEGGINATSGSIAGWNIHSSKIEKDGVRLNADSNNGYLGIGVTSYDSNDGIWLGEVSDGVYKFSIKNSDGSKYLRYNDSAFEIEAGNFSLDSSGNITATSVDLAGRISASDGLIGGFGIGADAITGSNFFLSGSATGNEYFISSSGFNVKASGDVTASSLFITGSGGTNYLQYKDGTLTVRGDVAATTISTPSASINEDGYLTSTSGSIGGFTIDDSDLFSTEVTMSKTAGGMISLKDRRFGEDGIQLSGSGEFFAGKKEGAHFKFEDDDVSISSSKFFMGKSNQFISGSEGNIEISSSGFHLKPTGDAVLSGSITSTEGSIANWLITSNYIQSKVGDLYLYGANSGVSYIYGGDGNSTDAGFRFGSDGAGWVADNSMSWDSLGNLQITASKVVISGSDVNILTPKIFLGQGNSNFISASEGNIEISSSGFHLKREGDAIFSGSITANDGTIGGFTINQTEISASDLVLKKSGQISGSNVQFLGGEIGGFEISQNQLSASGVLLKTSGRALGGEITSSKVLFDGGTIGGFTITEEELSIDNIKLSSLEKGLVISSSTGVGKVLITSGSLSTTSGNETNYFINPSLEASSTGEIYGSSSPSNIGSWFVTNDSTSGNTEELWNSGSITMSVATSDAADGSKHFRISVAAELGPAGTGDSEIPT